ncbi:hypothetical protein BGX29_010478 [Mortierella sp. GBA35]|nr:hypothetical protein BGX23_005043 [Mortierella sp. AD031]KAF9092392.1 hypothetical protein BGX29_010478 [Mortierella sp. GBA35]
MTTSTVSLRQYEKHHDHVNINKKPLTPTTATSPSVTSTAKPSRGQHAGAGAAASVVDQDLDDHRVQQAVDEVDLDLDADLKRRYDSHDAAALLEKDELGLVEDKEGVVTETATPATRKIVTGGIGGTGGGGGGIGGGGGESVLLEDKERTEEEFSWFVDTSIGNNNSSTTAPSVSSQDFVPLWKRNAQKKHHKHQSPSTTNKDNNKATPSSDDLQHAPVAIRGLVRMLEHERARNIIVMDMRQKCDWTDWMVIAEGLSERHVGNVADEVYTALKKMLPKSRPPLMEGRSTPDWVVIDTGSIILHFMTHETRKERNLEGLWGAVKDPLKLKDANEISWEDVQAKLTTSWQEDPGRSKGADHGSKRGRRGDQDLSLDEVVKG